MTDWVKIRSWHIVRGYSRAASAMTPCGRRIGNMEVRPVELDAPPGNEPTCEICLRWLARRMEAEEA